MNTRRKVLLTLTSVGLAAGLVGSGTLATFSAQVSNPGSTFDTGTLVLSDRVNSGTTCYSTGASTYTDTNINSACDALFAVAVRKPGDSATSNLVLRNEGSLAASALKAFAPPCTDGDAAGETYHGTGSLCSTLQLYVQQYSDAGFTSPSACLYGGSVVPGTCDFSDATKTVSAFVAAYPTSASALVVGPLAAGGSVYLRVGVRLPSSAGNSVQGRRAAVDLSWLLEQ